MGNFMNNFTRSYFINWKCSEKTCVVEEKERYMIPAIWKVSLENRFEMQLDIVPEMMGVRFTVANWSPSAVKC